MKLAIETIVSVSFCIVAFAVPFYYVLRSSRFARGVFLTWGLMILYFAIVTIPVYDILWYYDKELTMATLPEGNSIVGAACMGWLWGLIVAGLALLTRRIVKHFRPMAFSEKQKGQDNERNANRFAV